MDYTKLKRIKLMGVICTQPIEKDECNQTADTNHKSLVQFHGTLSNNIQVDLVLADYSQCKGESLLVIIQAKNLEQCEPLKDYTYNCYKNIEMIHKMRKTFFKPNLNKICPYKTLLLCMLPVYKSDCAQKYQQLFMNILKEALQGITQTTVEFLHTTQGLHTLPNQWIMGLLFKYLIITKQNFKLNLVTSQKKMMNFYRYELMKTQQFSIREIGQ